MYLQVVRQRRGDILYAAASDGDEKALRDAKAPTVSLGLLYVRATPLAKSASYHYFLPQ